MKHRADFFDLLTRTEFSTPEGLCEFQAWAERCAGLLEDVRDQGAKVYLLGNGASQAMSSHYAADLTKNALVPAFALSDAAMLTCFANDYSFQDAFSEILKRHLGPRDALIAISSSGRSPNVLAACDVARASARPVITLSGFAHDNPLRLAGSHSAYVPCEAYGHVECGHAYLMHTLLDLLCERRGGSGHSE
ncbi:MAG: SIS domain-containing protein [Deltaproteobacteria bacterium]